MRTPDSRTAPAAGQAWQPAVVIRPTATAATGMQVLDAAGNPQAMGVLKPTLAPPLRVTGVFPALSVQPVRAADVGPSSPKHAFHRLSLRGAPS